jgi:hypothetical protein
VELLYTLGYSRNNMPCNSCKKPKFAQSKVSPLLLKYMNPKPTQSQVSPLLLKYQIPKTVQTPITKTKKSQSVFAPKDSIKLSKGTLTQINAIEKGWIKVPSWFKNNITWVKQGKISESEFNSGLQSAINAYHKSNVKPSTNTQNIASPVNIEPVIVESPQVSTVRVLGENELPTMTGKILLDSYIPFEPSSQNMQKPSQKECGYWDVQCKIDQGIHWVQGGIEIEQKKQEQTVNDIINYPAQLQKQLDDELKKIDDWQKEQGRLRDEAFANALENAQLGVDGIITGVSDLGGNITGAFDEFGAGITQFGEDVQTNIGALGTGLNQFGKDLQTNVAGIGEGLDQFGKDMQKNMLIIGAVGLGAVVLMGMRK